MKCWTKCRTSIAVVGILISTTIVSTTVAFRFHNAFQQQQQQQHRGGLHPRPLRTPIYFATSVTTNSINDDEESNHDSVGIMTKMAQVDPSTCPFQSRYYPRIVPIPYRKRRKEEIRSNEKNQNRFWLPGQRTYIRNRFFQQQQAMTCNVEWVDSLTTASTAKSKYNHLLALASLWNTLGNVTKSMRQLPPRIKYDDVDNNDPKQNRTMTTVIAIPDADGYILEQFVTIVQWLLERQQLHNTMLVSYNNTQIDFMTIPTIIVTLNAHERSFVEHRDAALSTTTFHHDVITQRTKSWVQRVLVDTTICPFTKSITYSGQGLSDVNVPVGKIAYHTSHSSFVQNDDAEPSFAITAAVCQLQSDVLIAMFDMLQAGPTYSMKQKLNGISSILLAAPGWDDHLDVWTRNVFPILEVTVQVLDLTEQIGIVCFHPFYQTPDGRSFPGFGHMHSVPRLQQWLLDHTPQTDIEVAVQNSIPDLLTSNVIHSAPVTMSGVDHNHSSYHAAVSAIASAGGAWQRRTPHATINVLRADQLAAAESKRSTSTLYSSNILRLSRIGWSQLQHDLDQERNMQ